MAAEIHALNRFGLGARLGEARAIDDGRRWLRAQVESDGPSPMTPPVSAEAIAEALRAFRMPGQRRDRQARQQARRRLVEIAAAEARAALTSRLTTERPFLERLGMFWSNHLCVSAAGKGVLAPLAGSYEREAK